MQSNFVFILSKVCWGNIWQTNDEYL